MNKEKSFDYTKLTELRGENWVNGVKQMALNYSNSQNQNSNEVKKNKKM